MNNITVKPQNVDLAERFTKAIEKLEHDKETMEKIRDRNLWEKLFSNNTRDLARAGISQTEIISELNNIVQDMLVLIQKSGKNQERIMEDLHNSIIHQSGINTDFRKKIIKLAMESLSVSLKVKKIEKTTNDHENRIIPVEQIDTLCTRIREIAKQNDEPIDQFIQICKSAKTYLSNTWLSDLYKRKIIITVEERNFSRFSAAEINKKQDEICAMMASAIPRKSFSTGMWENFLTGQAALIEGEYTMSDAISGVIDAIAVSEGDRYTKYRDDLTQLLSEFIDKGIDIDNQYTPELTAIRKRLFEGQFEIALVGEFQGGKSTTFNTLCGGREISPRGLNGGGIKTSAAVITAQNISDGETKNGLTEWAEITWLTTDEIKTRICESLYVDPQTKGLNFDALLKRAWENNPTDDELDKLRIATLQYRVISSTNFSKIAENNIVGINDFQKLVRFPADWEPRWAEQYKANFTLEESLFSCVDKVLVRLDSPALRRLGCRITDCPGLFVSRWDTEKANAVMNRANAIWYLLNGTKQIGKEDEKTLTYIKKYQWVNKCFLSINRRKNREETNPIIKTDAAILKRLGFHTENLFEYNALLSFRLAQMKLVPNGLFDKDLSCLALESRPKDIVSDVLDEYKRDSRKIVFSLKRLIAKCLANIDEDLADEVRECSEISESLLATLVNEAGFNNILNQIDKWVVSSRARSILIDHGTKRCLNVLKDIQARQENIVVAASSDLEKHKQEADAATKKLDEFIAVWKENFSFLKIDSWDYDLCREFFAFNNEAIRSSISSEAVKICIEEWKRWSWKGKTNTAVNAIVETKIQDLFLKTIRAKLNYYAEHIKESPKFKATIYDKAIHNLDLLAEQWKEFEDVKFFKELNIPVKEELGAIKFNTFNETISGKIDVPSYFGMFFKKIWSNIGQFFHKLFTWSWNEDWTDRAEVEIKEFFEKHKPVEGAYDAFRGDQENEKNISYFLGTPRRRYAATLDEKFNEMQQALQRAIHAAEDIVNSSNEVKKQAATEATRVLQEIINPYKDRIENFEKEVCRFYAESDK